MEFPEGLQNAVEANAYNEFNTPTPNFGDAVASDILNETNEVLDVNIVNEFNDWRDLWLQPQLTFADFIRWVVRKIIKWWKSLFE